MTHMHGSIRNSIWHRNGIWLMQICLSEFVAPQVSIILVKNHHFLATSIWEGFWARFGRVWGPPNPWFSHFLANFLKIKFKSFFGRHKNQQKCEKAKVSRPLGVGPAEWADRWGREKEMGSKNSGWKSWTGHKRWSCRDCFCIWHALLSRWEAADLNAFAHSAGPRSELQSLK